MSSAIFCPTRMMRLWAMYRQMFGASNHNKIFRPVIILDSVQMMYLGAWWQRMAQFLFHDKSSTLATAFSVNINLDTPISSQNRRGRVALQSNPVAALLAGLGWPHLRLAAFRTGILARLLNMRLCPTRLQVVSRMTADTYLCGDKFSSFATRAIIMRVLQALRAPFVSQRPAWPSTLSADMKFHWTPPVERSIAFLVQSVKER